MNFALPIRSEGEGAAQDALGGVLGTAGESEERRAGGRASGGRVRGAQHQAGATRGTAVRRGWPSRSTYPRSANSRAQREERRSGEDGLTWEGKAVLRERRVEGDAPVKHPVAE